MAKSPLFFPLMFYDPWYLWCSRDRMWLGSITYLNCYGFPLGIKPRGMMKVKLRFS